METWHDVFFWNFMFSIICRTFTEISFEKNVLTVLWWVGGMYFLWGVFFAYSIFTFNFYSRRWWRQHNEIKQLFSPFNFFSLEYLWRDIIYYTLQKCICCCQQNSIYSKPCVTWLCVNASDSYFLWTICKFANGSV